MKVKSLMLLLLLIFFTLALGRIRVEGSTPSLSCEACILMDMDSKRVLYGTRIHDQMYIASITKIMTAIVALENGNPTDFVTISANAAYQVGSSLYLQAGERVKLIDLIYGLLLQSGNDAAIAISEHIAGSEANFAIMMNEMAKKIGMKNTVFENASGLDETTYNLSTAYDMALLMSYAMDHPLFRMIAGTKTYRCETEGGRGLYFYNKHRLIQHYDYITGGKTGYTKKAKRTLVTSASQNGLNLVVVTLNDGNDWADHIKLFDYGFANFTPKTLYDQGIIFVKEIEKILYLDQTIIYPLKEGEEKELKLIVHKQGEDYFLELFKGQEILLKKELAPYQFEPEDYFFNVIESFKRLGGYDDQ